MPPLARALPNVARQLRESASIPQLAPRVPIYKWQLYTCPGKSRLAPNLTGQIKADRVMSPGPPRGPTASPPDARQQCTTHDAHPSPVPYPHSHSYSYNAHQTLRVPRSHILNTFFSLHQLPPLTIHLPYGPYQPREINNVEPSRRHHRNPFRPSIPPSPLFPSISFGRYS